MASTDPIADADEAPKPFRRNANFRLICKDCQEDPPNLVEEYAQGDIVCGTCGLVLMSNCIDYGTEWRTFQNDDRENDDPSRVGDAANPYLNGSQLTTEIAFTANDARTRELTRTQKNSTEDKSNRALQEAYRVIGEFATAEGLKSTVANTARVLFKQAMESGKFKTKPQDAIIATVLFIACRQEKVSRSFKEIVKLTNVKKKDLGKTYTPLRKYFQEQAQKHQNDPSAPGGGLAGYQGHNTTSPQDLCGRYANSLGLPPRVGIIAAECAERLLSAGLLAGRSPLSVAAVCLYAVSNLMGEPRSTKEVGAASNVSDGTIRAAWRLIWPSRMTFIKQEWLEKGGKLELLPAPP